MLNLFSQSEGLKNLRWLAGKYRIANQNASNDFTVKFLLNQAQVSFLLRHFVLPATTSTASLENIVPIKISQNMINEADLNFDWDVKWDR